MGSPGIPILQFSITPSLLPLLGMLGGYLVVMRTNPVRVALRDGFRCMLRFKRIWLLFALLALAYSAFQFVVFSPLQASADLRLEQFAFWESWHWPLFPRSGAKACSTPPNRLPVFSMPLRPLIRSRFSPRSSSFSTGAACIAVWCARCAGNSAPAGWLIYFGVLLSALASLLKPLIYWQLPGRAHFLSPAHFLQTSAAVDTVAFIFEYLCAVYLQVYLIAVCLAWIKGVHFREGELLRFAMRRFSFVVKWLGLVVLAGTLLLRLPLLIAYFRNVPGVLDYLPVGRCVMAALLICFASMQISLVLHNESLRAALRAHGQFVQATRFPLCLVPFHLRAALLVFRAGRRGHSRRGDGAAARSPRLETGLRSGARFRYRLAARELGLSFSAMRNWPGES